MEVKIVKKEQGNEMTIEELAKKKHIGYAIGHERYVITRLLSKYAVIRAVLGASGHFATPTQTLLELLTYLSARCGRFNVFETENELYRWQGEE